MTEEDIKAAQQTVADRIIKKADDVLSALDREMTLRDWKPEFREIMWIAVAELANKRSFECAKIGGVK